MVRVVSFCCYQCQAAKGWNFELPLRVDPTTAYNYQPSTSTLYNELVNVRVDALLASGSFSALYNEALRTVRAPRCFR